MTFSIAARCPRTGALGVAVTSSSICVAARCAFARAGVGAALSQNVTDPALGPALLDACAAGRGAEDAMAAVTAAAPHLEFRQLALVDARGRTAHHSGARTLGTHAAADGPDCVAVGNLLADPGVPAAMVAAFAADPDAPLAARLIAALHAGLGAGGEVGPIQSAGVLVAEGESWPVVDLRVDLRDLPLDELSRLWAAYQPQLADYVTRARDPEAAPGFGKPGNPR